MMGGRTDRDGQGHRAGNAEIARVTHRGLLRVVIVATEAIDAREQVLVDYGEAYWRASGVAPRPLPRLLVDVPFGANPANPDARRQYG